MSATDLGNIADYAVNGDNYTRVAPDGSTLVIPGKPGYGPLAPTSDITPLVPYAYKEIEPNCPGTHCEVWVHDKITGFYHIGPIADYQPQLISCVCAIVQGYPNPNNLGCQALLQREVDDLAGQQLWAVTAPWLLTALGLPLTTPFFPDFWFITCSTPAIV